MCHDISCQYVSNTLLKVCFEEFGLQPFTRQVYLIKWPVSTTAYLTHSIVNLLPVLWCSRGPGLVLVSSRGGWRPRGACWRPGSCCHGRSPQTQHQGNWWDNGYVFFLSDDLQNEWHVNVENTTLRIFVKGCMGSVVSDMLMTMVFHRSMFIFIFLSFVRM